MSDDIKTVDLSDHATLMDCYVKLNKTCADLRAELAAANARANDWMDKHDKAVMALHEALIGLNVALDAFWNDPSRPAIHTYTTRGIEEWQIKSRAALKETEG